MDKLFISIMSMVVVWLVIYLTLLSFAGNSDTELSSQCKQLGGAYIRDNRNDFHCVALIKMENK